MRGTSGRFNGTAAMKMDSEEKNDGHCCPVGSINSAAVDISDE